MGAKQSHTFDEKLFNDQWERRDSGFDGKTVWRNKLNSA